MKWAIKTISSVTLMSLSVFTMQTSTANEATTSQTTSYGDNPNIFRVLAQKTGDKVQNTAERVGNAAERGINKIKPKVDNTWQNTKTYTADKAELAKQNTQKGLNTAVNKVNETKDAIIGTNSTPVPIERGSLSQTSADTSRYSQVQNNAMPTPNSEPTMTSKPSLNSQKNEAVQPQPEITPSSLPTNQDSKSSDNSGDDDQGLPR